MIITVGGCQRSEVLDRPDFAPTKPHLTVVTYNVNFGVAQPENITRFLAQSQASVVCLQETHSRWEGILRAALEERY